MIVSSLDSPVHVNLSTADGFLDSRQITTLTSTPELLILEDKIFINFVEIACIVFNAGTIIAECLSGWKLI